MKSLNELIADAGKLASPSTSSLEDFADRISELASKVTRTLEKRDDIEQLVGKDNLEMMGNNHNNALRFMHSIMSTYEPKVFVETVLWVFRTYQAHGFTQAYWPAWLDTLLSIMKDEVAEQSYVELSPFFDWLIVNIPVFAHLSQTTPSAWEEGAMPSHGE